MAEVGFVVQGTTDGIDATGGNYPIHTRISRNFVYEVATKMRGYDLRNTNDATSMVLHTIHG